MTSTLAAKAEPGRRILFDHASLKTQAPGIVLTFPNASGLIRIRFDGRRHTLPVSADSERITYLDEVVDVPDLPTGRFHPTPEQLEGLWEDVPVCSINEDGDIILLTTDRDRAMAAATAYLKDACVDLAYVDLELGLELRWAYFEWTPEDQDDEGDWFMHWTREGDDQAIRIYYLPA